jgi:hypothetical protein
MKRKIVFNTYLILVFLLLLVFIGLANFFLLDSEDGDAFLSIVGIMISAVPVFAIVISPVIYIYSRRIN